MPSDELSAIGIPTEEELTMKIVVTALTVIGTLALSSVTASAQNPTICHNEALAFAKQHANPAAGAVGGGVIGAVGGGILGKVFGKGKKAVGAGAVIGGTAGALAGAASAKKKHDQFYNEQYYRCMNVPAPTPVIYDIPPAGSPQWNYHCSLKYNSFQPGTGTFQPFRPYAGAPLPPRRVCVLP